MTDRNSDCQKCGYRKCICDELLELGWDAFYKKNDKENKNDGGPAFPELTGHSFKSGDNEAGETLCNSGMTLRDYFAAHSNIDYQIAQAVFDRAGRTEYTVQDVVEQKAYMQYCEADAMLKERDK